ncbi:ubiquitin-specific protease ubp15, partial [Coemansia sp. RSA 2673]
VFEEYYGGSFPQQQQQLSGSEMRSRPNSKRFTNAYMLVYIREALRDRVLNPGDTPVPDHLLQRIQREKDEEARRQLERQHIANTLSVKVADDENFTRHQGFDLCYFDQRQAQDNTLFCERLPKNSAEKTGKKESDFRLWSMVARVNKTVRCDVPLLGESMAQTLSYVKDLRASKWPDLRLYCEMRTEDSPEDFDAKMPIELSMIHIRFYDPSRQQLTGMGRMYVHANQLVQDITPQLREAAVLPPDAPITLYEEVKPSLIDKMDVNQTNTFHLETVDKFFDELQHRVCVRFVPRPARNNADEFGGGNGAVAEPEEGNGAAAAPVLLASSKSPYDSVAQWLAGQLGMRDPLKLRFYTVGPTGQARQPVRRMATTTLVEMLPNSVYSQPPLNAMGQPEYTVMFERLEVDILQIDSMRAVRVTYVGRTMKEELQLDVLVPRTGPSQKLIEATYVKVDQALRNRSEAAPMPFALRTYVTNCHRLSHVLDGSENIAELGKVGNEQQAAEGVLIEVFHFYRELNHAHSVPFLFRVIPGELWAATWARLERKLGLGEKELRNLGVVYGAQGTAELKRCRVVQGGEGDGESPSSGQHTPSVTPPPAGEGAAEDAEAETGDAAGAAGEREGAGSPESNSTLCLWDLIQQ